MAQSDNITARADLEADIERLARSCGPGFRISKQRALLLIDDAAKLIINLCGKLPPDSERALGQAIHAVTAYDIPRLVNRLQAALVCLDRDRAGDRTSRVPRSPKAVGRKADALLAKLRAKQRFREPRE